jgi:hypothetical protein
MKLRNIYAIATTAAAPNQGVRVKPACETQDSFRKKTKYSIQAVGTQAMIKTRERKGMLLSAATKANTSRTAAEFP